MWTSICRLRKNPLADSMSPIQMGAIISWVLYPIVQVTLQGSLEWSNCLKISKFHGGRIINTLRTVLVNGNWIEARFLCNVYCTNVQLQYWKTSRRSKVPVKCVPYNCTITVLKTSRQRCKFISRPEIRKKKNRFKITISYKILDVNIEIVIKMQEIEIN